MSECDDVLGATRDVIVLGIALVGDEMQRSPQRLLEALQSQRLRVTVEQALRKEGERLAQQQARGEATTPEDGTRMLGRLGEAAGTAIGEEVLAGVQRSSLYREAERRLRRLECAFQNQPVGIFLSENPAVLYIVAAGVALGTATAMYVTRSGDVPASWATALAQQHLRFRPIGNLEIGADEITFRPEESEVGIRVFATATWRRVETTFKANALFHQDTVAQVGASGQLSVRVDRRREIGLRGALSVGRYRPEGGGPGGPLGSDLNAQLRMLLTVRGSGSQPTISASLAVEAARTTGPGAGTRTDVRVIGGLTVHFR